jgi:hypothetical protein
VFIKFGIELAPLYEFAEYTPHGGLFVNKLVNPLFMYIISVYSEFTTASPPQIQGVAESIGRSKSAIFGRDKVSYENFETVKYSGREAEGIRGICYGFASVNFRNSRERSS